MTFWEMLWWIARDIIGQFFFDVGWKVMPPDQRALLVKVIRGEKGRL